MVKSKIAIFFDRDGTLIKTFVSKKNKPISIKKIKDIKLLKDVKYVVNNLSEKYRIIVITNQPDVSRGKDTKKNVRLINNKLKEKIKKDNFFSSYSSVETNYLRKPNPGMIMLAKNKFNLSLKKCFVVGDTEKDIIAGNRAGCKTVLIKTKYNNNIKIEPDYKLQRLNELLNILNLKP